MIAERRGRMDRTPSECPSGHEPHTGRTLNAAVRVLSVNLHQNGQIEANTYKRNC